METAYHSGKATGQPRPLPTRPELVELLKQAGFRKVDFDRLSAFKHLSNEVSCDIELMVDSVPSALPTEKEVLSPAMR